MKNMSNYVPWKPTDSLQVPQQHQQPLPQLHQHPLNLLLYMSLFTRSAVPQLQKLVQKPFWKRQGGI